MKILVIHGSMRKGNTYSLTKKIMNRLLVKPDIEFIEINVSDLDLPFCCSCHVCFEKGEEFCPHYKVIHSVQSALMDCDAVIFSGTTYMWALNASMKNLLDHLSFYFHRPAFFRKKGMVVITSAGAGEKSVAKYLKTVLGQWGINGAIMVTLNTKEKQLQLKREKYFDNVAERYYKLIASKKLLTPSLRNIAVHNSFRAMSLSEFGENKRDTQYWSQAGFCDKAYPVKAGAFKYVIGSLVYGIVINMLNVIGRVYEKRLNIQK